MALISSGATVAAAIATMFYTDSAAAGIAVFGVITAIVTPLLAIYDKLMQKAAP